MERFIGEFELIQRQVHDTAISLGWWEDGTCNHGQAIALMHSELSEALEYMRNPCQACSDHIPDYWGVEEELADVIIRIMDYAEQNGLRIAPAILAKAEFNKTRPHRHGGKAF